MRDDTDTVTMATAEIPLRHDLPRGCPRVHSSAALYNVTGTKTRRKHYSCGERLATLCYMFLFGLELCRPQVRNNRHDRSEPVRQTPTESLRGNLWPSLAKLSLTHTHTHIPLFLITNHLFFSVWN